MTDLNMQTSELLRADYECLCRDWNVVEFRYDVLVKCEPIIVRAANQLLMSI